MSVSGSEGNSSRMVTVEVGLGSALAVEASGCGGGLGS